jgi:hypothetical protein
MANLLILEGGEQIVFSVGTAGDEQQFAVTFKSQVGLGWEAVPSIINPLIRNAGQTLIFEVSANTRRMVIKHPLPFKILSMSYNLELLLGWQGVKNYPIESQPWDEYLPRRGTIHANVLVDKFLGVGGLGAFHRIDGTTTTGDYAPNTYLLEPAIANMYTIKYTFVKWLEPIHDTGPSADRPVEGWCYLNPDTGTMKWTEGFIIPGTLYGNDPERRWLGQVRADVYEGGAMPSHSTTVEYTYFYAPGTKHIEPQYVEKETWEGNIRCRGTTTAGLLTLQFGEVASAHLVPKFGAYIRHRPGTPYYDADPGGRWVWFSAPTRNVDWYFKETGNISFQGASEQDDDGWWHAVDNLHAVSIKAGNCITGVGLDGKPYYAKLYCKWEEQWDNVWTTHTDSLRFEVINDLIPIIRHKVEAPAVGNPMSTPQLYLMSNCGNQVYRNSVAEPDQLVNAMVSATMSNSFSPGYPILASGETVQRFPTSALANLSFWLVDGNFRPVKLLNPMYLTITVNPIEQDPSRDISQWNALLPINAPTPEQKAKAEQAQQAQQQQQQALQAKEDMKDQTFQVLGEYFGEKLQAKKQQQEDQALLQTVAEQAAQVGDPKLSPELTGIQYLAIKQQKQDALVEEQRINQIQQANEQAGREQQQQQIDQAKQQAQEELEGFVEYAPDL